MRGVPTLPAGRLRHSVTLANPTTAADGDGGFTTTWTNLTPATVRAEIQPATERSLERVMANTVGSRATHLVTIRHHASVTTKTRVTFGARTFQVVGTQNPGEVNKLLVLVCTEIVS